ncbi:MAG: restriction endonuclease subunit S [Cyclobacteriaceae bacterium]|nr:restriction endonuclease subunit S [Cyclobacteriaceae bacterium]
MKSNYKKLGTFIEPINKLNDGMEVKELLGINNNKYFQESHTNTIGIDLATYRIVRTGQFAYNRATTRNGDKISISLRQGNDCIVSPSYRIFRSKDENVLNSEYLMMWFRRPEFDRYARFKSHGSAHEFFEWEQMTEVDLPIPHIDKQREIVKEYNTIQNRIALNQQLIQKLEETAQAIYKQWFVDFEFPDENGKPYKSNGGEMVWNEELGKEIPKGWTYKTLGSISNIKAGGDKPEKFSSFKTDTLQVPIFSNSSENEGLFGYTDIPVIQKESITISARGAIIGYTVLRTSPFVPIVRLIVVTPEAENQLNYLYETIRKFAYEGSGSAQGQLTIPDISAYKILLPDMDLLQSYQKISQAVTQSINTRKQENEKLMEFKELLLSRLATVN